MIASNLALKLLYYWKCHLCLYKVNNLFKSKYRWTQI